MKRTVNFVHYRKVSLQSKLCIFLDYSLNHKRYKCLDTDGKIIISKNVLFDESSFPYKSPFMSTSNTDATATQTTTTPAIIPQTMPINQKPTKAHPSYPTSLPSLAISPTTTSAHKFPSHVY